MRNGLRIVDFHAHLVDSHSVQKICPEEQNSPFFRHAVPLIEQVANLSEPIHDGFLRHLALHFRCPVSRSIYGRLGQLALMEALRLFKLNDLERLLKSMARLGIDHTVIYSIEPLTSTARIIEQTRRYRDRISVFASVSRDEPDPVDYLEPFVRSGDIAGFKIHPVVGGYACGELYWKTRDLAALACQAGLPIVIHTGHIPVEYLSGIAGCNEVGFVEPLIAEFPRAKFVLAHMGWESWRKVFALARRYDNVLVETSWQPARVIRRAVDALGAERVLFGSDFPLFKQELAFKQVEDALSPQELVKVASTNALRLLKISASGTAEKKATLADYYRGEKVDGGSYPKVPEALGSPPGERSEDRRGHPPIVLTGEGSDEAKRRGLSRESEVA